MTLDEYRIEIIEKLKGFSDPARARGLLAEVDLAFTSGRLSIATRRAFWEGLHDDLDVAAQEAHLLVGARGASTLVAVISVAQSAIEAYVLVLAREMDKPTL